MFDIVISTVDALVGGFVESTYLALSRELGSTFTLMATLSVVLYGFALLRGYIEVPIREFTWHLVMLIFVFGVVKYWGPAMQSFYDIVTNAPSDLGGVVLHEFNSSYSSRSINDFLGATLDTIRTAGGDMLYGSAWNAIGLKLAGLLLMLVGFGLVVYAGYLIVLSKIATAILFALAPVFIPMLIFKNTRGLFEGWLRQLLNFALIPLIAYTLLVFIVGICDAQLEALSVARTAGHITDVEVMPVIVAAGVSLLLMMQVTGIASGIAGGISINTGSIAHAARHAQQARGALRNAGNGVSNLINRFRPGSSNRISNG